MKKILFSLLLLFAFSHSANAQYWSRWYKPHNVTIGFSADEKWAFFIQKNAVGIDNIFKVEMKTNAVTPVTDFNERPVLSAIAIFGKPAVVFARATTTKGDEIHLYRVNVLTADEPVDFTPTSGPSNKTIIGMAYNGRYVYYLSDKGPNSKTDTYRYDATQYITELALANDKDYKTLCWSRDQTHLLIRDPKTLTVFSYSIETTDKQKVELPFDGDDLKTVFYDPMNTSFYMINKGNQLALSKITASGTSDVETGAYYSGIDGAELSLNGKYIHTSTNGAEKVMDNVSHTFLDLPQGGYDMVIGPKESSVLYTSTDALGVKLFVYDIAKKTSKELTVIK